VRERESWHTELVLSGSPPTKLQIKLMVKENYKLARVSLSSMDQCKGNQFLVLAITSSTLPPDTLASLIHLWRRSDRFALRIKPLEAEAKSPQTSSV